MKDKLITEENQHKDAKSTLPAKPDEICGILIESKLKIFDPDSGEIYIEGRG